MSEPVTLEGLVEEIIFSNYANGYTVCVLDCDGEPVTATGCMPYLSEGESVKVSGSWTIHAEYGRQFSVSFYEKVLPSTSSAILRYLASGIIKGVRLATAKKIVDTFGDETLNILSMEPLRLATIKGISRQKAAEIGEAYAQQQGVQATVMFLQQYGIGPTLALKIHRRYGQNAVAAIKDDPYILVDDINGVSFKTADRIAMSIGVLPNNLSRLKAAVKYILIYQAQAGGHTYLPLDDLVYAATNMLGVDIAEVERAIYALTADKELYTKSLYGQDGIFLKSMFFAEHLIAAKLMTLSDSQPLFSSEELESKIDAWQALRGITLASQQRRAVETALNNGVSVLTGGPGTGKTTIVNAIISLFTQKGLSVALAAPTGRAAKRASELTGIEAKTIHRLLENGYTGEEDTPLFNRDETNPLSEDAVIIDEASMVDVQLGSALFRALKAGARFVIVGDIDQLPPVGAGNMLSDIIKSGTVPTVRLTEIFRQAAQSMIVTNAHRIIHGESPVLNQADSDFYFVRRDSVEQIAGCIADLCKNRLPRTYGYQPLTQIQVLSPTKKGPAGSIALNQILQNVLNPPDPSKREKAFGSVIFREGDKVMQIKNNYDLEWDMHTDSASGTGVFNGDMGTVERIEPESRQLVVVFDDGRCVHYDYTQAEELSLAYAVTVHKSQGSEFDVIVMPVFHAPPMLMRRNLLYTAVTRAKKFVVLVGSKVAIDAMVAGASEQNRYTSLAWILNNGYDA